MRISILCLAACLAAPCLAAPHEVAITMTAANGPAPAGAPAFSLLGPKNYYFKSALAKGAARPLQLEPGYYSLHLWPDVKSNLPGKVWHGLAVSSDAKDVTHWDLKIPVAATLQGKILLPDGKPAVGCLVAVQSGSQQALSTLMAPQVKRSPLAALEMADKIAHGAQHAYGATRTDNAGNFVLKNLVPANYALDVFYQPQQKWFTIPFAPVLQSDADKGTPTNIGEWKVPAHGWDWLFDAKAEHGAIESKYTGQGKVEIAGGVLRLGVGDDMTGLNWPDIDKEKVPRQDYEISFDARRVEGVDFFAGLTFPYGDKPISWIVGGWGGTVVGLSNVNGFAAVENETTRTMEFVDERWYRLRLRVSKPKVEAWIDEEKVIDLPTADKEFTIRWSVEPSLPLGFATWKTGGELRDIRIRSLEPDELAAIAKSAEQ